MKKITMLSLLALSAFMIGCSGEKQEAQPVPESPVVQMPVAPTAEEAPATMEEAQTIQEVVEENIEKTTDKIGTEVEKVGDAAKEKVDEGVNLLKEKIAN
ncbi:MAG: hypothetical protein ACRC5W_08450 [Cetobacterium sp.]|uniref:hypothetical protein n=1 Tax=Cetobacterium sp. TaxID=2071632 RepID=UPI003F316AD5